MKDKRIIPFQHELMDDNLITSACARFLYRLTEWRYCTQNHAADCEFALSAREVMSWFDDEGPEAVENEKTVWGWFREAVLNQYLFFNGRAKSTPPKSLYRLNLNRRLEPLTLLRWGMNNAAQIAEPQYGEPRVRSEGLKLARKLRTERKRGKVHTAAQTEVCPAAQTEVCPAAQTEQHTAAQTDPPILVIPFGKKCTTPKGRNERGATRRQVTKRGKVGARGAKTRNDEQQDGEAFRVGGLANGARGKSGLSKPAESAAAPAPPPQAFLDAASESASKHGRKSQTPTAGPTERGNRKANESGPDEAGRKQLPPATQAFMDLPKARFLVKTDALEHLTEAHVVALLKAGDTLPPSIAEKFAALCERHNPIPA